MNRLLVVLWCCILVSCNTSKKVVYMQDVDNGNIEKIAAYQGIVVKPKDLLFIVVSSKNPELASAFNLPMSSYHVGGTSTSYSSYRMLGYTVDEAGNIDFPILGLLSVKGKTSLQVSAMIKERLRTENLLGDAIVTTEFMNFRISVMGEVRSPGMFDLQNDRITILEALSRAGDLTIYGRRDNILVRREIDGVITFYRVDVRSVNSLIQSPAYYLQQNDVVYVSPNNTVAANSRINQNRTVGVGISIMNLLVNFVLFGITLSKL